MLFDLASLIRVYGLRPAGVLHIGAHLGEEASAYHAAGISRVVWIEANEELIAPLRANVEPLGHTVINAVVSDRAGAPVAFNVTNNGQSSSILPLGTHVRHYPDVFVTRTEQRTSTTVDALAIEHDLTGLNLVNLDIQGAELLALRGAGSILGGVDAIYTEVNREAVYEGCSLIGDVDAYLGAEGFKRVVSRWKPEHWGDALYVRGGVGVLRRLRGRVAFRGRA
jgi:FkbM family methyltransferase